MVVLLLNFHSVLPSGIAPASVERFTTAEDCCKGKLHWVAASVCVGRSQPPFAAMGSYKWYASYEMKACAQDCKIENNQSSPPPLCGGIVHDAYVTLYDSPTVCCEDKLGWIPINRCLAHSINEEENRIRM